MDPAGAPGAGPGILDAVERIIQSRRVAPREGSYVSGLLAGGDARIAQKVGEEAAEVMVAALAEGSERLVAEVADLWFHTLVLMGARGLSARHVFAELGRRHRPADGPPSRDVAAAPCPGGLSDTRAPGRAAPEAVWRWRLCSPGSPGAAGCVFRTGATSSHGRGIAWAPRTAGRGSKAKRTWRSGGRTPRPG